LLASAKRDVVEHGLPGQQPVFLEHDPYLGCALRHGAAQPHASAAAGFQTRDKPQQRGLAGAARTYQGNEFTLRNIKIYMLQNLAVAERFSDIAQRNCACGEAIFFDFGILTA
jgi:hypothetical protein